MRRGIACCTLVLVAVVSTPASTATSASQTKSQGCLPTLTPGVPRSSENGPSLDPKAAINIDGRQPFEQNHPRNERRRGTAAAAALLESKALPSGLVQSCFLQPCSSAPVIRERAGRKAELSTCKKPERSATRCRHGAKPPTAKRRR